MAWQGIDEEVYQLLLTPEMNRLSRAARTRVIADVILRARVDAQEASVLEGERRIAAMETRALDAEFARDLWAARVSGYVSFIAALEARLEAVVAAARGTG